MQKKRWIITFILGIGIIPPIFFSLQAIVLGTEEVGADKIVPSLIFSLTVTTLISFSIFALRRIFEKHFPPENKSIRKRIILQLVVSTFVANIIMVGHMFLFREIFECVYPEHMDPSENYRKEFFNNLMMATVLTVFGNLILESSFLIDQWKKTLVETEKLKRKNLQSQFESLKNQVNPHFLFNSLNALSSLVHTDPIKAEEFIDEFAKIYRYVLDIKHKVLVPLQEEYQFIKSFFFLQKIRFEKNLIIDIAIEEKYYDYFIPPLSLQELIENAIKHNIVSSDNPLRIEIFTAGGYLIIRNNLQLRMEPVKSTQTGLKNIKDRYLILDSEIPEFQLENEFFTAKLPLIKEED